MLGVYIVDNVVLIIWYLKSQSQQQYSAIRHVLKSNKANGQWMRAFVAQGGFLNLLKNISLVRSQIIFNGYYINLQRLYNFAPRGPSFMSSRFKVWDSYIGHKNTSYGGGFRTTWHLGGVHPGECTLSVILGKIDKIFHRTGMRCLKKLQKHLWSVSSKS